MLSRHAIGLAMDVFEVRLDDGRVAVVKRDYGDVAELAAVERVFADSASFRNPLTPGQRPEEDDDHFHLEARGLPLRRDAR
ncbi:MAG: extensin family protein [Cytophagales bacterium]|nr:extensin family protein [Cytophagales bacterium]